MRTGVEVEAPVKVGSNMLTKATYNETLTTTAFKL
jgi:hypothetical protein